MVAAKGDLSSFQANVLRLQTDLFRANQRLINDAVGGYSDAFVAYERRYRRSVRRTEGPRTFAELITATREARVVLVGDYHTLAQSQRAFYRLLRRQPAKQPVVVALEMLPSAAQADIDKFLSGRLQERTFLRRVGWAERWPFGPLDPFRPILELARTRGWRVIGLDLDAPGGELEARDAHAATRLAEALEHQPSTRAFALMGEMHLAPGHLPRATQSALRARGIEGGVLRVHQNPERIWFDLAASGVVDEHDVVALPGPAFALLSASPVVQQQSFLTWLDQVRDGDLDGPHAVDGGGERVFRDALRVLGRTLGLPTRAAIEGVEVVGPADLSFFEVLKAEGTFDAREMRSIRHHILASESYYVPRAKLVYLATLSLNHAAEEASHCLRHFCSGEGLDDPHGLVDAFYARALNEAIGFMGSKVVNPKRKCVDLADLRAVAGPDPEAAPPEPPSRRPRRPAAASTAGHGPASLSALEPAVARYVLAHKRVEQGQHVPWLSHVFQGPPQLFNAVTHILGYLLGERLYYGLVRGVISKRAAQRLYYEPFEDEGAALLLYFELAAKVGMLSVPKRP